MKDQEFKTFLNRIVIEDLASHITVLQDLESKTSFLLRFEDQYVDYVHDIIGILSNNYENPDHKKNVSGFLMTCDEDEIDNLIKTRVSRKNLIDFLVKETSDQERADIIRRQNEIKRVTPEMIEASEHNNEKDTTKLYSDLHSIPQENIRIRKSGEFYQESDRMVIKDPSFCSYIKTEDVVTVKPGNWDVYLIETNINKEEVYIIGCFLKHEDDQEEIFPTLLNKKWETVMAQRPINSSILSVIDENYFNQELTEEQLAQFNCPFEEITQWYEWCRKVVTNKGFESIKGGYLMSQMELRNRYNVLVLKDAKAEQTLIGIEFKYDPRVYRPIFNYYVYESECSFPF